MGRDFYKLCKVLEIDATDVLIEVAANTTLKIPKERLPKFVVVGDFVRHCEHGMYDVVDKDGAFVYR